MVSPNHEFIKNIYNILLLKKFLNDKNEIFWMN